MGLGYINEKEEECPNCDQPWSSQAHYDLQSCKCLSRTDGADARTVLMGVADSARRWVPDARIIGNTRADDILRACNEAIALIDSATPETTTN